MPPKEDFAGTLDVLERRAAHLSSLIYPAKGERPERTAHWRDEAELRALRVAIRCVRSESNRADDTTEKNVLTLVGALNEALELFDALRETNPGRGLPPALLASIEKATERFDELLEEIG